MAVDISVPTLKVVIAEGDAISNLGSLQGSWSDEQYLRLSASTNRLLEYTDGVIEVLPMPTYKHQVISRFLLFALFPLVQRLGGTVVFAPLPLRLRVREGKFREPDLMLLLDEADPRLQDAYWLGADLVVEVVSPDSPERDTHDKRFDYAHDGVPEYWIVDPEDEAITVLRLEGEGQAYVEHGTFRRADTATSDLLADFRVSVDVVFDER